MAQSLMKQRSIIKGKLTRFKNYLENFNSTTDSIEELEVKLQNITGLGGMFDNIQNDIEENNEIDDSERAEFENAYDAARAKANKILKTHMSQAHVNNSNVTQFSTRARLPETSLPQFSGHFSDWINFKDTFNSLIHNNNSLTPVDKFHYLKASLRGEAARVIQTIAISENNYNIAWQKLIDRYEDRESIILKHIKSIFDIATLQKESHVSLRRLADDMTNHLEAVKSVDHECKLEDRLLIHIVVGKLDPSTKREWERHISHKTAPSVNSLFDFLIHRSKLLEKIGTDKPIRPIPKSAGNVVHNTNKTGLHTYTATQTPACMICNGAHKIFSCNTLRELPATARISKVKMLKLCTNCLSPGHISHNCRSKHTCRICQQKHNTVLHIEATNDETQNNASLPTSSHCSTAQLVQNSSLLPTAIITVFDNIGQPHQCRVLLDSGSQSNFITKDFCKRINAREHRTFIPVTGVGQQATNVHHITNVKIRSNATKYEAEIQALVLTRLTDRLPNEKLAILDIQIPRNIQLADPTFNEPKHIDMLLGVSLFWEILGTNHIKLPQSNLLLHQTQLGWVVSGHNMPQSSVHCNVSINEKIYQQIKLFWEIDTNLNDKPSLSDEDKECENHFANTVRRDTDGRFIVRIPFKPSVVKLGASYSAALKRFYTVERKLSKNPELREQYSKFMQEYESLGHMTKVTNNEPLDGYYLPHHAVLKEDSLTTKLRVVFDGSQKTSTGVSLNEVQMTGPPLQNDLFNILMRFRIHTFVVKADIEKMYRQVLIEPDQRKFQKIFWRNHETEPVSVYQLNTVTYGTSSAPFLAIRALKQLALEYKSNYPKACQVIRDDFYVDDLICGAESIDELIEIKEQVSKLLLTAHFPLRKWVSNEPQIVIHNNCNSTSSELLLTNQTDSKTLGIIWNHTLDHLHYYINITTVKCVTKRSVLSNIAQVFDPLGLIGPITVVSKLIMQKLWQRALTWDEPLPADLKIEWEQYQESTHALNELTIPRRVTYTKAQHIELHGFCDASLAAYGACIYMRTVSESGDISVQLMCAKSRVAPLKPMTLPRLELSAALILSHLMHRVRESLPSKNVLEHYWSDSTITLCWIASNASRWKQFVANRVGEIHELTNRDYWRHVSGEDNPADIISRGASATQLKQSSLWWHGPTFLSEPEQFWPNHTIKHTEKLPEERLITVFHTATSTETTITLFTRYSCFTRLKRVVALLLRFIANCRPSNINTRCHGPLTPVELENAESRLVRIAQETEYFREIAALKHNKSVHNTSKLITLNPFLDSHSLLRVGGRIGRSNLSYQQKHPFILPGGHPLSTLIITYEHKRLLHAGADTTLSSIRYKYWLTAGRSNVKRVIRTCIPCFRIQPRTLTPLMGELPSYRVTPCRPFIKSGVDYAGPFLVKETAYRNKRFIKTYLAIFVCMSTKAAHIEIISDLSTQSFLGALNRFVARRGNVSDLYSDNGTQFVGANNELKNLRDLFMSEINGNHIINSLANNHIQWHFQPPRAPNFGGLWEATVKSIKLHFKRVVGNAHLNFDTFFTMVTQIEAIINSRPLTPLSCDPNDLNCLTPAHFLIGDTLTAHPHPDVSHLPQNRVSRWQHIEMLRQHFWKRWSKEYISLLQQRARWKSKTCTPAKVGQLVVIKDDNLPPLRWLLGRIINVHPGKDGVVRVLTIKTVSGVIKRAANKVSVLPIDTDTSDQ